MPRVNCLHAAVVEAAEGKDGASVAVVTSLRAAADIRSAAAVAVLKVVRREEAVQEEAHREVRLRGIQAEVAVAPAAMTMIIMLRAAVAVEAAGDSFCHKTDKTFKTLFFNMLGWQRLATACRCLTRLK